MKVNDLVKLVKDFEGMPEGTMGGIVSVNDDETFDVEFLDDDYCITDVFKTPAELLEFVWSFDDEY